MQKTIITIYSSNSASPPGVQEVEIMATYIKASKSRLNKV